MARPVAGACVWTLVRSCLVVTFKVICFLEASAAPVVVGNSKAPWTQRTELPEGQPWEQSLLRAPGEPKGGANLWRTS